MNLNYKNFGSGKTLIILHGLFGMLDNWLSIAKILSKNFEVFILDLRNHGRSEQNDIFNYQVMAADLKEFLEEQNIFKCHILGHSMGGKVALQFAALYPGYVEKLILADIFPKDYPEERPDHIKIFKAIKAIESIDYTSRTQAENKILDIIKDERLAMFLFKNLKKTENKITWRFHADAILKNYPSIKANIYIPNSIKVPTLLIKGGLSDYVSESDMATSNKMFDNIKFKELKQAGHWLHVDQKKDFIEFCQNFLHE